MDFNRSVISGFLLSAPRLRMAPASGVPVVEARLTHAGLWIDVLFVGNLAEEFQQSAALNSEIVVEGRLRMDATRDRASQLPNTRWRLHADLFRVLSGSILEETEPMQCI